MTREKGKGDRRRRIIDAAETLIRKTGSTDFSMNMLARQANLSTPTTYNLIGSKATVLYTLLNQYQDRLDARWLALSLPDDPFEVVLKAAENAVRLYSADGDFIKPLMRFLLGIPDPLYRPAFMARGYLYWSRAFEGLARQGYLSDHIAVEDMARDFVFFFSGIIDFWVQDELTEEQFSLHARLGVLLRLLALGVESANPWLREELQQCRSLVQTPYSSFVQAALDRKEVS